MVDVGAVTTNAARRSAREVIRQIESFSNLNNSLPSLMPGSGFIAGSLGRLAQEQPLDDIDVYLVMDANGVTATTDGILHPLTAHGRLIATPLTSDPTLKVGGMISSGAIVARYSWHLPLIFPDIATGIGQRRKTCFVRFGGVNIDLCPVVRFSPTNGGIDQYWMPVGGGQREWKATNPRLDQDNISAANGAIGGDLLKVVRLMKWWNARHNDDRLKGIHLETMVAGILPRYGFHGWAHTLQHLFAALRFSVQAECPDPTDLGSPLSSSLSDEDRAASLIALEKAERIANRASQLAGAGDIPGAMAVWRLLFMLPSE